MTLREIIIQATNIKEEQTVLDLTNPILNYPISIKERGEGKLLMEVEVDEENLIIKLRIL